MKHGKELTLQVPEERSERLWKQKESQMAWMTRVAVVVVITVLAALGVSLYVEHQGEIQSVKENFYVAEKLKFEIDYQAALIKEYLENVIQYQEEEDIPELVVAVSKLLLQVAGKDTSGGFPANLFSEYADQSMASLLLQLQLVLKYDSSIQQTLDAAIESAMKLQNMGANIHSYKPTTTLTELIEGTKRQLNDLSKVTRRPYLTNDENSD